MQTFPPFTLPNRQFLNHERMLLAGLPFFPASFSNGGEKIKIVRSWQSEFINNYAKEPSKKIFVRLQPPEYRIYEKYSPNISFGTVQMLYQQRPDLEIVWLGQIKSNVYLILEQTPLDLDDETFIQYVVRLNSPNSVNVVGNTELQKLIPIIRNEIESSINKPLTEITQFLGAISVAYSPEYYFDCIKERCFTRNLRVRWDVIAAGRSIPIRRWQRPLSENLSISVPVPSDPTINEDFLVKEYLNINDDHYLILQAERTLISGEHWEAYLVKLKDNNIFSLDDDLEFQHMAQLFVDHLEKPSRGNIFRPLGSITIVEIETVLDYLFSSSEVTSISETNQKTSQTSQEKTQLTNLVPVKINKSSLENSNSNFKIADLGQALYIKTRWRISNHLYLSLIFFEQLDETNIDIPMVLDFSTLSVECVFSFNFWYYIVLKLPETISNTINKSLFILKIQDSNTLITLTEEEFNKIKPIYANNKNNNQHTIADTLALLNSLSSEKRKDTLENIAPKILTTKPNNRITKAHLGTINNYYLEKELYKGSLFIAYLAKQTNLGNRTVLLKILYDHIEDKTAEEFLKEVALTTKLEHPNTIKIYQAGKSHGYYFAAMQFIEGKNLFDYLKEHPFVAPTRLLFIVEQLASVLDYAHQNNILHSKISPSKILITPKQKVFLLGFTNKETAPAGDPRYMAPEQILEDISSVASDIYSLSFVTYEALTGKLPFEKDYSFDKEELSRKTYFDITSPQHFNKFLPKTLDSIFQKALSKDPKERYQKAKDFFEALKEAFSNLANLVKPLSEFAIIDSKTATNKVCLGLSTESFYLENLIGEGVFSWVYYGVNSLDLTERAFKIAKPPEFVTISEKSTNLTQEIEVVTGGITTQRPNIYQLFQFQVEKTQKVNDIALVKIDKLVHTNNICYYQMEFIKGNTLRELMDTGIVPVRVIVEIALSLERLSKNPQFRYHGDLKPENIIVSDTEVKFIDIGYFGCEEKTYLPSLVTTPAYYPDLQADDLFALGLIVWEIVCGQQPFALPLSSSEFLDLSNIGENLFEWVYQSELAGQYFKTAILHTKRPSELVLDLEPELENFLLKAINLHIRNDNKLDRKVHFKSFSEFASELEDLVEAGITHL